MDLNSLMNVLPPGRRVGALALALLIVTTAALSGVGGPASPVSTAAADWSEECELTDTLIGAAWNTLIGADSGCRWESGTHTDWENVTATDGYASALSMKDAADSYTTTTGNFMENTRTVAYSKAKITLINELNNGSSVSVAQNEVNQTVREYYSRIQLEAAKDFGAKAMHAHYLANSTGLTAEVGDSNPYATPMNAKITLINGTVGRYHTIGWDDGTYVRYYILTDERSLQPQSTNGGYEDLQVTDPDNGGQTTVLSTEPYWSIVNSAKSQSNQVLANMDPYVDEVYAQYAAGEINSTNLAMNDPTVIANEASTSLNSTGYYGHASIMLASLGAGGDVNVSHTVETSDGTVMNGTLFYTAQDAPETGWATNTTYNFSDYNGTFYYSVARNDGTAGIVDLENYGENFTLTKATNTKTGESVETTVVHRYTYDSTNVSALAEEIERLQELREEYEHQKTSAAGGSGPLSGFSNREIMIGVGALAVVAYIYGREEDN